MALVDTNKTEMIEVPHEGGEWIEVRSLLATEMDEAKEVRMKRLLDMFEGNLPKGSDEKGSAVKTVVLKLLDDALGEMDIPENMERAINIALAKLPSEAEEETLAQRIQQYDALTLLKYAVVNWSYDYPVKSGSLEHVELLDAVTRDWLLEEVVQRNTRPLASTNGSNGNWKWDVVPVSSNISTRSEVPE